MSRNNHNLDQTTKDTHSDEIERVFFNGTTLAERTTSYLSDQKTSNDESPLPFYIL